MSTKKNRLRETILEANESQIKSNTCTVRDFYGRPKVLYVEGEDENGVFVKPVPGRYDRPLCLPRRTVYAYDPDLLSKLERAYRAGKAIELDSIWKTAPSWNPSGRVA